MTERTGREAELDTRIPIDDRQIREGRKARIREMAYTQWIWMMQQLRQTQMGRK